MDFVHDQLATGRKIRVLTVVDTFSRFSPASIPGSATVGKTWFWLSRRPVRRLARRRPSGWIRARNSSRRDLYLWAYANEVTLDFSRPGKPTDNAFIEAFNGRLQAECLNAHWFLTLADAREKLEAWCRYYNEERPHGAIGNQAPISLQSLGGTASPVMPKQAENSNLG